MKRIIVLVLSICAFIGVKAQSEVFPLYFSQLGLDGTANYMGRAGAIGAVGGDIMSANYNPAGLGIYRVAEMTFSTGLNFASTSAFSNELGLEDDMTKLTFGNFGVVLPIKVDKSGLKYIQMSFAINRLKTFSNNIAMRRDGLSSSFIDGVVMNDIVEYNDAENEFIRAGVVELDTNTYSISSFFEVGMFNQFRRIKYSGSLNEFSYTLSGNLGDKLYFGVTAGIPFADMTTLSTLTESKVDVNGETIAAYTNTQQQDLSAVGVNLKLGAIFKPISPLRIGVAIHTPTAYSVQDDFSSIVQYDNTAGSVAPTFFYGIQTPFRFLASTAVVLGDISSSIAGTISADYEYFDYSMMRFNFTEDVVGEYEFNTSIEDIFRPAHTFRIGGELKCGPFSLRAGYAMEGNPYVEIQNDASINYTTFGVGYRKSKVGFDLAYVHSTGDSKYYWYDGAETKMTEIHNIIQATLVLKF
jgi:hypothetical protein